MDKKFCTYCMSPVPPGGSCPVCGLTEGSYRPSPHHLPPGTVLQGRYLVGRVLGEGGFGITYIGCDLRLEMKVAIKEYYPVDRSTRNAAASLEVTGFMGLAARSFERGKQRFLEEARTMARLAKQQVIVGVRDHFEANNTAYIVMEYIEGTTFSELARQRGGRIPPEELFAILEPLFGALSIVHENGLLHRDIAPDNLMLENGRVRLLDFGCAREASVGNETLTITLKHGYAPLEQYQQKGQGPWTDIYALCATIYYCLTGKAPPPALDRIAGDELLLPSKLGVALPPHQEAALLKGLAPAPNRRFSTMEELRAALYAPAGGWTDVPAPPPAPEEPVTAEPEQKTENAGPVAPEAPPSGQEGGEEPARPLYKRPALWLACGAAAVALAAGVGLWPRLAAPFVPASGAVSAPAAQAAVFTGSTEEELRSLLEDEDAASVTLPAGCEVTILRRDLTLSKPLVVEEGARLELRHSLTVTGDGLLRVEGHLENQGLLRTENAGRIQVGPSGTLTGESLVWLEKAEDLTVEEGGRASLRGMEYGAAGSESRFFVLSEQALFEDAVHAATWEEFRDAVGRADVSAIVIDGDMELLLDGSWSCSVPLAISEGVTVTAAGEVEQIFVQSIFLVDSGILVNRGVLDCPVNTGSDNPTPDDRVLLVNYGEMRGDLFLESPGAVINYGTVVSGASQILRADVYTTGRWVQQGRSEGNWMNFYGRLVWNMGEFLVSESNWVALNDGTQFFNSGTLTVEKDGTLFNRARLDNNGILRLEEGALLDNSDLFFPCGAFGVGKLELDPDARFANAGLVNWNRNRPEPLICQVEDYGGHELALDDSNHRGVTDEAGLRQALADDSCTLIQLDGDVTVTGDLTLTKGLAAGGASLCLTGGSLTLEGEEAMLAGKVDLGGGALTLLRGATALCPSLQNCASLTLDDALLVCDDGLILTDARVSLTNASLLAQIGLELKNSVLLAKNSSVRAGSSFILENSEVNLEAGAALVVSNAVLDVDGASSVTTAADSLLEFQYNHDRYPRRLEGTLTLGGSTLFTPAMTVEGSLVNEGELVFRDDLTVTGALTNRGTLRAGGGAQLLAAAGGVFTGAQPVSE